MNHATHEPSPARGQESVTDAVIDDLHFRRKVGILKYGTELETGNGRRALVDAYQEILDLALYIKQRLMEDDNEGRGKVDSYE